MPLKIVRNDISKMTTEAVVNRANEYPAVGPGCDRAVYEEAELNELLAYIQPTTPDLPYIWTSVNDKSKTENAIMASGDDTKVFTYDNETISYSASAMGVTKTIKLHRSSDLSFD